MKKLGLRMFLFMMVCVSIAQPLQGQEARRRWEFMNEIRREKFDLILPKVMRENNIDMWITVVREGYEDPLTEDFGKAYVSSIAYYIFTDRGEERMPRGVTFVSGPSSTGDIIGHLVKGAHGPRRLRLVLLGLVPDALLERSGHPLPEPIDQRATR